MQGPLDQLELCYQAGETMLRSIDFGDDSEGHRHCVLLAIQEMVTNVLRHAYEGDESLPIEVEFTADERGFGMMGSGVFVINPPHPVHGMLQECLPVLAERLSQVERPKWALDAGLK